MGIYDNSIRVLYKIIYIKGGMVEFVKEENGC